jgi:hypothetical protein
MNCSLKTTVFSVQQTEVSLKVYSVRGQPSVATPYSTHHGSYSLPKTLTTNLRSTKRAIVGSTQDRNTCFSIRHPERRGIFRPGLPSIIKPGCGDVRVPEPLLDLGDVCRML